MEKLAETWGALSIQKRVTLVVSVIASIVVVWMLAQRASEPSMALLYGGLDERAAGEVAEALQKMGVKSDVRRGSIYVPSNERDRLRVELARQGLPAQGQSGYELLDGLSGFGTTSEMFQATYWRAREGELARTILSVPGVRSARVHIGAGQRRPFSRTGQATTAAVTVQMGAGGMTEQTALAIRYLVALAIPDLAPEQVAVIDARNGVVLKPGEDRAAALGAAEGSRRAEMLTKKLTELLEVRVGAGNAQVSVSVETSTEAQTISERIVDPESRVPVTSETQESTEAASGSEGAVTVASNLPDGDAANNNSRSSNRSETRESVSYQYSETRRDQVIEPGAVKRIGVAVLINEIATVAEDGSVTYQPRPAEEIQSIQQLVQSAIAFDEVRGDVVTIESMRFAALPGEGEVVEPGFLQGFFEANLMTLIQLGVLAVVALALGMFVIKPIVASQREAAEAAEAAAREREEGEAAGEGGEGLADGDIPQAALESGEALQALPSPDQVTELPVVASNATELAAIAADSPHDENFIATLRDVVRERSEDAANQLRVWLASELEAEEPQEAE